jgi:hypothetical protein
MRNRPQRICRAVVLVCLACALLPGIAQAGLLFDDGTGNFSHDYLAGTGAGQSISVSTPTNLTNIAVDFALPSGGDVKFLIFDSTNSTLLLATSSTSFGASPIPNLHTSPAFNFALNAGETYFFGYIADAASQLQVIVPCLSFSQNGLATSGCSIVSYTNFVNPVLDSGGFFMTDMTLQLFGTQNLPIPEPPGIAILGFGLLCAGLLLWLRLGRRTQTSRSAAIRGR